MAEEQVQDLSSSNPEQSIPTRPAQQEGESKLTDANPEEASNEKGSAVEGTSAAANEEEKPSTQENLSPKDPAAPATEEAAVADQFHKPSPDSPATNGTPASAKKTPKRKSTTGVPEHKTKKLQRKKSQVNLNTGAQPGDYYLVKLKGFPPWPAIICDEAMLPHVLLSSRPATAKRPDGTWKEGFGDDEKKVSDRTFPVMFMGTNEFGWISNKDLNIFDPTVEVGGGGKGKSAGLQQAFTVAAEGHDLDYWKTVLREHEEALQADAEAKAAKKAKSKEKGKRKSTAIVEDEDDEMADADGDDDAEGEAKPKTKKRKKGEESEGEGAKPAKSPKKSDVAVKGGKLKLSTPKAPNGTPTSKSAKKDGSTAKAKPKAKKAAVAKTSDDEDMADAVEEAVKEEKPLSAEELLAKRKKDILYLRHKLQKGFLTRDVPPKEEEMKSMSIYINTLEQYRQLEVSIIRETKINKVLKGIIKLSSIPQDAEYNFKRRSHDLLTSWSTLLAADPEAAPATAAKEETTTNGVSKHTEDEKKSDNEASGDKPETVSEEEKPAEKAAEPVAVEEKVAVPAETAKPAEPEAAESEKPVEATVVETTA